MTITKEGDEVKKRKKHRKHVATINARIKRREQERNRDPDKKGARSEEIVDVALRWLQQKEKIERFRRSDGDGKDFIVETKHGEQLRFIEVKSSQFGLEFYFEKKEKLRRKGRKVRDDVIVIVVGEYDTFFSVAERTGAKLS